MSTDPSEHEPSEPAGPSEHEVVQEPATPEHTSAEHVGEPVTAAPGPALPPQPMAHGSYPQPAYGATPPRKSRFPVIIGAAAMCLASGLIGAGVVALSGGTGSTLASPTVVQPASENVGGVTAIAKAVQPSVVSVTVKSSSEEDEGSGVIIKSDGTIMTNNHVVASASDGGQISVRFNNGQTAAAKVVGTDPTDDIAVIKATNVSGVKPATLGDSDALQVGDPVVAIGSPLGLDGSVSSGIVSALHRTLTESSDQGEPSLPGLGSQNGTNSAGATIGDAVQTDAPINEGNSGGPLVNGSGQIIGIDTAIATTGDSSGSIGIGFAIPINTAKQVADQLISTGKATHAFLGVDIVDSSGSTAGALISSVQSGAPAAKAGLKEGDVVTAVNGQQVTDAADLAGDIRTFQPGQKVTLTYVRGGKTSTVTVTLTSSSTG